MRIGTVAAQKKLFYNLRRIKAKLGFYDDTDLQDDAVKQIAKELDVPESDVVEMNQRLSGDVSLNTPVYDDGYAEKQDFLRANDNIEDELAEKQEKNERLVLLSKALLMLNERERLIIEARRLKEEPETLESLGERLGISRERVRQIETRAFEKMTAFIRSKAVPAVA